MHAYLAAMWKCRFFWLSLVKMDLRSRYRGSILGLGWSLLHPIAMTALFCVVFRIAFKQDLRTYAPLVFTGFTFWGFFSASVLQGCGCFFQGESYIRQFPAPLAIYPLRNVLAAAFHFSIGLMLAIGIGLIAGPELKEPPVANRPNPQAGLKAAEPNSKLGLVATPPHSQAPVKGLVGRVVSLGVATPPHSQAPVKAGGSDPKETPANPQAGLKAAEPNSKLGLVATRWDQLLALPSLLPSCLLVLVFGWSLSVLSGLLSVRFRDTRHLSEIALQGLFYVTPIMYPAKIFEGRYRLTLLLQCNPLTTFLDLLREPLLKGQVPSVTSYAYAASITLLFTLAAMIALRMEERRLIFHL
jgi:ABC-type polysaccharide/polyol phosphate export permease